jgi:hypothetical protein
MTEPCLRLERGGVFARRLVLHHLGETEVEHLDDTVGRDHHVAGLQVAVDDALGMGGGEGVRDRDRDAQRFAQAHPALRDQAVEGLPGHELHHDEVDAVRRLDLVDRDDVGMVERGGGLCLLDEAGTAGRVGHPLRGQDLDRHLAAEARIASAVHLAHSPGAERGEHLERPYAGARCEHLRLP